MGSQGSHADRAANRASGSTYRKPKGREGVKNPWHQKEPLPDNLPRFSDARLPAVVRRARKLEEQRAAQRGSASDNRASLVDFEVQDGAVVRIKGRDGKRAKVQRVKTPLHKALKLQAAKELAERQARGEDTSGIEWPESEQLQAERAAERFLEQQMLEEQVASERAALQERMDAAEPSMTAEAQLAALADFDTQAVQAVKQALQESDAAFAEELQAIMEHQQQGEDGEEGAAKPKRAKRTGSAKKAAANATPEFGVQTVLKFLKEYDFAVQLPAKKKRGSSGESDPALSPAESARAELLTNPLNQSVLVYDVASRFVFADYLVVVKAQSARQMRHLAESCLKMARALDACKLNRRVLSLEGRDRDDWMLLDAGFIWLYFFNTTPSVKLPPGQGGLFGVDLQARQPNFSVRPGSGFGGGDAGVVQPQLPFLLDHATNSVSFATHTAPLSSPGVAQAAAALRGSSRRAGDADEVDPDTLPHLTTSPQINSSAWFEPTPDSPAHKKKGHINAQEAARQMHWGGSSGGNVIDADYSAVATQVPSGSSSGSSFFSSSSSDADPALALLHSSAFVHPVLENLERSYGDLRVAPARVDKLRDYPREDLRNDVVLLSNEPEQPEDVDEAGKKKARKGRKRAGQVESVEVRDLDSSTQVLQGGEKGGF